MYWLWFFIYCTQPTFLILGLFGVFGEEGKKAAEDVAGGFGMIVLILIAGGAIYLGLNYIGVL